MTTSATLDTYSLRSMSKSQSPCPNQLQRCEGIPIEYPVDVRATKDSPKIF